MNPLPGAPRVETSPTKSGRLISLDAYRGFVMLLMISAGFAISKVTEKFPGDAVWAGVAYQTQHAGPDGNTSGRQQRITQGHLVHGG